MKTLIKNGWVIDPAGNIDKISDILIEGNVIKEVGENISGKDCRVIDATGKIVAPGFIDIHVHLRSPGQEHKEDFKTGSYAAAAGGFTSVCPMANTSPPIDSSDLIQNVIRKANELSIIRVLPVGTITKKMKDEEIVDVGSMLNAGCIAFSEDGKSVKDDKIMKEMFMLSGKMDFPVICHCEDPDFEGGVINSGDASKKLNLKGIPSEVEEKIVKRDINLSLTENGYCHITHNSTAGSIKLIREAKKKSKRITCDVTPHHFSLDEGYIDSANANFKMNPPLRTKKDVEAIIEGIKDGTVDCIATDHAPHSKEEKNISIDKAPFGVIGLETALSVASTFLVEPGHITWKRLIEMLTLNPARIIKRLELGTLSQGARADIVIIDPELEKIVIDAFFKSKSLNSPFIGMMLKGFVTDTFFEGKHIYSNGKVLV
jgi:dihydroorotase